MKKKKKKDLLRRNTYLWIGAPTEDSDQPAAAFVQSDLNLHRVHFGYIVVKGAHSEGSFSDVPLTTKLSTVK